MNRPGRILIVDDLEQWREELTEILQHADYYATSASTTTEARELLNEGNYHILVLDVRMNEADQSDEDGINLLGELEKSGLSEATQVIMLSAYGTKERTRTAFKEYQVADFLMVSPLSVDRTWNEHNSQKLLDRPDVIGEASSHSRCSLLPTRVF